MITNKIDQSPPIFFWQNNFLGKMSQPAQIIEKGNLAQRTGAPQSRQSAKLFLQSSELGLPQPITGRRGLPPPLQFRGRGTFAGERGGGRVPIPTRGHILWYSVYIYTYFVRCTLRTKTTGNVHFCTRRMQNKKITFIKIYCTVYSVRYMYGFFLMNAYERTC